MSNVTKLGCACLLTLLVAALTHAQQPAAPASKPLPKGKIALINTAVLQTQIGEYKAKVDALEKQFEPRTKELQGLADRINALETTIKTQSGTLTAARVAEMTEQLEQMKRDYRRKQEDLQADGQRVMGQALGPIKEKLGKFLEGFTAKRGIVVVIDLANAVEGNALVWFDQRLEITQEFIAEYNRANPVATSTPPKP